MDTGGNINLALGSWNTLRFAKTVSFNSSFPIGSSQGTSTIALKLGTRSNRNNNKIFVKPIKKVFKWFYCFTYTDTARTDKKHEHWQREQKGLNIKKTSFLLEIRFSFKLLQSETTKKIIVIRYKK